jgi:uncharacterized protein YjbI with pentapeptide repeats
MISREILGKLLLAKTTAEMLDLASRHRFLFDGKVDLSGAKAALKFDSIDLKEFKFSGADLSGSRFINCPGEGVSFDGCKLDKAYFSAEKGKSASMVGASFRRCSIKGAQFGARMLDLSSASFAESDLKDTKFVLGKLIGVDFTGSRLRDVQLRGAQLDGARFQNALLERVCLENASLVGADFTDATLVEMEQWGEPNFAGAIIADALRYQYGIVEKPLEAIDRLIASGKYAEEEKQRLERFRERVATFASNVPAAMLIASEYEDIISFDLFVRALKQMKKTS